MLRLSYLRRLAAALLILCAPAGCAVPSFAHAADGKTAVLRAIARHHAPRPLTLAVAEHESSFRCDASSGVAFGVMQVKKDTARSVGVRGNLKNCDTGAEAGVRYLMQCLRAARGSWALAAHFYNHGVGTRSGSRKYASAVMSRAR